MTVIRNVLTATLITHVGMFLLALSVPASAQSGDLHTPAWGEYRTIERRSFTIGPWPEDPESAFIYDRRSRRFARLTQEAGGSCTAVRTLCVRPFARGDGQAEIEIVEGGRTLRAQHQPARIKDMDFEVDGVRIAGRLWSPEGPGPHPAVVVIGGTGGNLRDDYRIYPALFVRQGYAFYAFDKQGFGESGGERGQSEEAIKPLARVARAAVEALRQQSDIHAEQIGVMGISHGSWVAIEAASQDPHIAFVIPVVGGGVPLWRALQHETRSSLARKGHRADDIDEAERTLLALFDLLRERRNGDVPKLIADARVKSWFKDTALAKLDGLPAEAQSAASQHIWDSELSYDPAPALRSETAPLFAIAAERDDFTPSAENLRNILDTGGDNVTTLMLADANHWQAVEGDDDFTYAPELEDRLEVWLEALQK